MNIHILCEWTKMDNITKESTDVVIENVLYDLWFSIAESIFNKVCEVTELNHEQINALKLVALRPNDFHIVIT